MTIMTTFARQAAAQQAELVASYRRVLAHEPDNRPVRRALAQLMVDMGRADESIGLWRAELASGPEGSNWADDLIGEAMTEWDLSRAGAYADIVAGLRLGAYCSLAQAGPGSSRIQPPRLVSQGKLQHDIEQFAYLQARGVFGEELTPAIIAYEQLLRRFDGYGHDARLAIDDVIDPVVRQLFGRIIHVRPTGRCAQALASTWSCAQVEAAYLDAAPGIVVIDDFLTQEALTALRAYCLESTLWWGNRYGFGRLGAFFRDGFSCPLLLQIAEELRARLPRLIGTRFPLKQLWGFKNSHLQPADAGIHADFAAVNVNFWITPETANARPDTGGMSIFTVDAPLAWDFDTYNGRPDLIADYLARQGARRLVVPYRANRAVIFNSDLFHGTDAVDFLPGYENRRISITMLYGMRETDTHHGQVVNPANSGEAGRRSSAFSRTRWRRI